MSNQPTTLAFSVLMGKTPEARSGPLLPSAAPDGSIHVSWQRFAELAGDSVLVSRQWLVEQMRAVEQVSEKLESGLRQHAQFDEARERRIRELEGLLERSMAAIDRLEASAGASTPNRRD